MKEKLKLLARDAYHEDCADIQGWMPNEWSELLLKDLESFLAIFAKKVAAECAELCTESYHTPDGYGIVDADERCYLLIKERFGVE